MKTTDIKNMLISIGMSARLKGTSYTARATELYSTNTKITGKGGIYSVIAEEFNDTESRVERAIRHAVGSYFDKKGNEFISNQFRGILNVRPVWDSKPSNSEFISLLAFALEEQGDEQEEVVGCEGMERLIENIKKLMHAGNEDTVLNEILGFAPETLEDLNIMIEDELSAADSE